HQRSTTFDAPCRPTTSHTNPSIPPPAPEIHITSILGDPIGSVCRNGVLMSPSPAITAVVPTHNRPEQMRRAVESILSQDYGGPIEVIVVFDAETPYTPDVEVPEGRSVTVMENQRSRGLAGGRNTGILSAKHD